MSERAASSADRFRPNPSRMTVRELARTTGITPDAVRHYVRIGLLRPERDERNGYKLFFERDVIRVRFIRCAQRLGYTLKEIKRILHENEGGRAGHSQVGALLERHISENRKKLAELNALQRRMEKAIARWQSLPEEQRSTRSFFRLIESMEEWDDVSGSSPAERFR